MNIERRNKFIEKANKVHNNKYNYSKVEYINSLTKVKIICPEHGEFSQTPQAHLRGNSCPICANKKRGDNKRWDKEKFINESIKIHGDIYDYSFVNYINSSTKVEIICKEHGSFKQTPSNHLNGQGCPKCAGKNLALNEVIERFKEVHGDKYNYDMVVYNGMHKHVDIICKEHGVFKQTPAKHINGQKCPLCSNIEKGINGRLSVENFIERSNKIHNYTYDYSKVNYKTTHDKVEIVCDKHGSFFQYPYDHLNGYGCPTCGNMFSIGEMEIYQMIVRELGDENVKLHDRDVLDGKELDIFIPSMNIGIEYNGLYWHSEEKGKDKWYHYLKTKKCNEKGIKLIQIFEDEYNCNKELVLNKIKHILNIPKQSPKIMGRKTLIKEIEIEKAKEFLNKNHIQGYSNSTIILGSFFQGILIGVMCFTKTGKENEWVLNRFATDNNYTCQGVGGKLFSFFIRKYNPLKVKSFADKRWTVNSENNLYTKLGFVLTEELKPDYRYIDSKNPIKRIHKFNLRKKTLHNHYNFPLDMTEKEMVNNLGLVKIWDCGLYKYEWKRTIYK